jgi:molybdopterin molybdotransferase
MISVNEARRIILTSRFEYKIKEVPLIESTGKILAESITASCDIPGYDCSSMDGYAVRSEDVKGADVSYPVRLLLAGGITAEERTESIIIDPGFCIPVNAGSPMPAGTDSVIMKENTQVDNKNILVFKEIKIGENVKYRGEDIKKGETVFEDLYQINPAAMGILASLGKKRIKVYGSPLVGIISTGSELIGMEEEITIGKLRDSNSYSLSALVEESGGEYKRFGIIRDERAALSRVMEKALVECDVIIISGGTSIGDYDNVEEVMEELGAEPVFWRVNQYPGMSMAFFRNRNKLIFGLPGNPASSIICFEMYVRPVIRKILGYHELFRPAVYAEAERDFVTRLGTVSYSGVIVRKRNQDYIFDSIDTHTCGTLSSLADANGIAFIPGDIGKVTAGSRIKVYLLSEIIK